MAASTARRKPTGHRETAAAIKAHTKARETWSDVTRQIDDRGGLYRFDARRADVACEFFPTYLRHFEGEHAGKPFELLPWQRELLIRPLFGWVRRDGTRRFRKVFIEIGKKNGKSGLSSGLALLLAFADGEAGAQVFCAAGAEEQARIVFRPSAEMARASREFREDFGVEVLANALEQAETSSVLRPLTSKAKTQHGLNVHALIFDEFHAQRDRDLWDTLYKGISARRQPVVAIITTAGDNRESICYEEYEYAKKVRDGLIEDDSYLPLIFEIDAQRDDWTDERVWRKANPSLGVTKHLDYMRTECAAARAEPRKRNSFLRLDLNVWTESRTQWITPEAWAACAVPRDQMAPRSELVSCAGLDLSSTQDLTALVVATRVPDARPPQEIEVESGSGQVAKSVLSIDYTVELRAWFFVPREVMYERERRDRVPYSLWVSQGWITPTDGTVTDYNAIRAALLDEVKPVFPGLVGVGYDPWNASHLTTQLLADGVPMVEVRQGYGSLSAPSKLLEALVLSGRIRHDGNPVLAWCVANAETASDPAGNIKPVKPGGDARGTRRIDGLVASIIALSRLMVAPVDEPISTDFAVLSF